MNIAVNTSALVPGLPASQGVFLYEVLQRVTHAHPEHHFLFISDSIHPPAYIFGKNVQFLKIGPSKVNYLRIKLWYDIKLPHVLKKYAIDLFVSTDGFCSLRTNVPQCLLIPDAVFLQTPSFLTRTTLFFYRRYTPRFLNKAAIVATYSNTTKTVLIKKYGLAQTHVKPVYKAAAAIFQPLDEETKDLVKNQYTGGKQFFIYTGSIHPRKNLLPLLKAFSVFKKRQKSDWKLVLAGPVANSYKGFAESIQRYKYREDIVLTGYLEQEKLAGLMGSAYALIDPSLHEGFSLPVLEAMQSAIPVIAAAGSVSEEIAGDAALYANANDHLSIAEQLMLLYKDESLRTRLQEKGKQAASQYSWDRSAELLWECMRESVRPEVRKSGRR